MEQISLFWSVPHIIINVWSIYAYTVDENLTTQYEDKLNRDANPPTKGHSKSTYTSYIIWKKTFFKFCFILNLVVRNDPRSTRHHAGRRADELQNETLRSPRRHPHSPLRAERSKTSGDQISQIVGWSYKHIQQTF